MLRERTAPAGSPETLVSAAINLASFRARRRATDNDHGVSAGVLLTVINPAITDHAALLGLRPEGGPRRNQSHQHHGKCCHPLHEPKLAVRTPGVNNLEVWAHCWPRHDRRWNSRLRGRPPIASSQSICSARPAVAMEARVEGALSWGNELAAV